MAKIGPKEAAMAALRARRAGKPAKTVAPKRPKPLPAARVAGNAKPSQRSQKRPLARKAVAANGGASHPTPLSTPAKPKLGRPSTGFDRTAYQRLYCQLWRRNGKRPSPTWPEEDRQSLATLKTEKPI